MTLSRLQPLPLLCILAFLFVASVVDGQQQEQSPTLAGLEVREVTYCVESSNPVSISYINKTCGVEEDTATDDAKQAVLADPHSTDRFPSKTVTDRLKIIFLVSCSWHYTFKKNAAGGAPVTELPHHEAPCLA